jgi:membrane-bound metal-dependent hydrolase YbcI (DUF457 family)
MPDPVTHALIPMFLGETYRRYISKRPFAKYWIYLLGFFAAAPDLDLVYSYLRYGSFDMGLHRTWTHSLLPVLFFAIAAGALYLLSGENNKGKISDYKRVFRIASLVFMIVAIGFASHTLLDMFNGFNEPLYPFYIPFGFGDVGFSNNAFVMIDGILFFAWLLYDEEVISEIKRLFASHPSARTRK